MNGRVVVVVAALLVALSSSAAAAHTVGLSRGIYTVTTRGDAPGVTLEIVFARGEVKAAVPAIDQDGDGLVGDAEAKDPAIGAALAQGIAVTRGEAVFLGELRALRCRQT